VNAKVVNQGNTPVSSIGQSFNEALIAGFGFTLLGGGSAPSCAGFTDIGTGAEITLCSDGSFNGVSAVGTGSFSTGSQFLVSIDASALTVSFTQVGGQAQYSAGYSSNDNLKYFIEFAAAGAIQFNPSLEYASLTPQ